MERDTKQLSCSDLSCEDYDLTFDSWLKNNNHVSNLSGLNQKIESSYFKNKNEVLKPVRWRPSISPYLARVDLNNNPKLDEDNRPKYALEIGLVGKF